MTRKCFACGETKGLKSIENIYCDCGRCEYGHKQSACWGCYFSEEVSCEVDGHDNVECLNDVTCDNHEKTMKYYFNWNDFDYHYKLKKRSKKE